MGTGKPRGESCLKRLIVTADDFGLSPAVNAAVASAHCDGILTTASLMVAEPAAADAVDRARRLPGLGVGLHIVVVDGHSVLPPAEIPALVGADGRFRNCLACAGLQYFFSPAARRQLAREIRAQFESFQRSGLPLDHVNAHHHMHLHPTVLALIISVGKSYGLRAIRLPREPLWHRRRFNWPRFLLSPWLALMRWRIRRAGLLCNDYIFGLADTGRMDQATLLETLDAVPEGVAEVFFHPAVDAAAPVTAGTSDYSYSSREYEALVSRQTADTVSARGFELIAFRDLA